VSIGKESNLGRISTIMYNKLRHGWGRNSPKVINRKGGGESGGVLWCWYVYSWGLFVVRVCCDKNPNG
jgi:hypothetical protein